jgi:hypothetical protein
MGCQRGDHLPDQVLLLFLLPWVVGRGLGYGSQDCSVLAIGVDRHAQGLAQILPRRVDGQLPPRRAIGEQVTNDIVRHRDKEIALVVEVERGPRNSAAILFAAPNYFTGWRAALVLFVPLVTDAACSAAVGLPVYNALHVPGAPAWVTWAGALVSCAIGLAILDALARWIYAHTLTMQQAAESADQLQEQS